MSLNIIKNGSLCYKDVKHHNANKVPFIRLCLIGLPGPRERERERERAISTDAEC
jgi:hypothetical protein